jgi:hypothetical protein
MERLRDHEFGLQLPLFQTSTQSGITFVFISLTHKIVLRLSEMTVTKRYGPRQRECVVKDPLDVEEIKHYVDNCYRGVETELERIAAEPIELEDDENGFCVAADAFHRSFPARGLLFLSGVRIPWFRWSWAVTRKQQVLAAVLFLSLTFIPSVITAIAAGATVRWYDGLYFDALCGANPREIWEVCATQPLFNPRAPCEQYAKYCTVSSCLLQANNLTDSSSLSTSIKNNDVRTDFPRPPSPNCTQGSVTTWKSDGVSWFLAGYFAFGCWLLFVLPAAFYYEPRAFAFLSRTCSRTLLTVGHVYYGFRDWHETDKCTRQGWTCHFSSILHCRISMPHLKYCFLSWFAIVGGFMILCAYGDVLSISYGRRPYYPVTATHFCIHVLKFFCLFFVPGIVVMFALTTFIRMLVFRINMLRRISDLLLEVRDLAVMGNHVLKSMLDDVALARDGLSHLIQKSIYTWSPTVVAGIFVCGTFLIIFILKIVIAGPEAAADAVTWSLGLSVLVLMLLFILAFVSGADNDFREQLIVLRGKRIRNLTAQDVMDKDGMVHYRTSWREEVDSLIQWMWHRPLAVRVMGVPITQDLVKAVGYLLFTLGSAVAQTLIQKNTDA